MVLLEPFDLARDLAAQVGREGLAIDYRRHAITLRSLFVGRETDGRFYCSRERKNTLDGHLLRVNDHFTAGNRYPPPSRKKAPPVAGRSPGLSPHRLILPFDAVGAIGITFAKRMLFFVVILGFERKVQRDDAANDRQPENEHGHAGIRPEGEKCSGAVPAIDWT